ncbi:MAG: hypothetical protein V4732_07470 [Pseudomonadota bacterium]
MKYKNYTASILFLMLIGAFIVLYSSQQSLSIFNRKKPISDVAVVTQNISFFSTYVFGFKASKEDRVTKASSRSANPKK